MSCDIRVRVQRTFPVNPFQVSNYSISFESCSDPTRLCQSLWGQDPDGTTPCQSLGRLKSERPDTTDKKKKIRLPKHACPSGSSLLLGPVISRRARIDPALIRIQQTCLREQSANKPLVPRNNWGPINRVSSVSGFAETMQVLQLVCKESIIYLLCTSCMLSQTSLSKHNYSRQHKSGNKTVTSRLAFCLRITCISCYSLVSLLIIKVKLKYSAFFHLYCVTSYVPFWILYESPMFVKFWIMRGVTKQPYVILDSLISYSGQWTHVTTTA